MYIRFTKSYLRLANLYIWLSISYVYTCMTYLCVRVGALHFHSLERCHAMNIQLVQYATCSCAGAVWTDRLKCSTWQLLRLSCARIDHACNVVPVTGACTFALLVRLKIHFASEILFGRGTLVRLFFGQEYRLGFIGYGTNVSAVPLYNTFTSFVGDTHTPNTHARARAPTHTHTHTHILTLLSVVWFDEVHQVKK